jgi:hypothetical protein
MRHIDGSLNADACPHASVVHAKVRVDVSRWGHIDGVNTSTAATRQRRLNADAVSTAFVVHVN